MGNIKTYLKWRDDLTFAEHRFCEVDNLILSELVYLDLAGIVPDVHNEGTVTVAEAAKLYRGGAYKAKCIDGPDGEFLEMMAESNRYRDVKLSKFEECLDEETQLDFCAMHAELGDETVYVAFRGTSNTLTGWREDFSMSYRLMPSQKKAAEYLEQTMTDMHLLYRIGGHSKGGNLAVYAAMKLSEERIRQVIAVYNNDGPGFCKDCVDMNRYRAVEEKLIRIVPEFSIVGALFENEEPAVYVKSSVEGIHQHDGMTWQVEGDLFCRARSRNVESVYYNHLVKHWIGSVSMEQREAFTADLFDALAAGGASKRTDSYGLDGMENVLLSMAGAGGKTKLTLGKFLFSFFKSMKSAQFSDVLYSVRTAYEMLGEYNSRMVLVAVYFVQFRQNYSQILSNTTSLSFWLVDFPEFLSYNIGSNIIIYDHTLI